MKTDFTLLALILTISATFLLQAPPKIGKQSRRRSSTSSETSPDLRPHSKVPSLSPEDCALLGMLIPPGSEPTFDELVARARQIEKKENEERAREARRRADARRDEIERNQREAEVALQARKAQRLERIELLKRYTQLQKEFEGLSPQDIYGLWYFWEAELTQALADLGLLEEYKEKICRLNADNYKNRQRILEGIRNSNQKIASLEKRIKYGDLTPQQTLTAWLDEAKRELSDLKEAFANKPEYVASIIAEDLSDRGIIIYHSPFQEFNLIVARKGMMYLRKHRQDLRNDILDEYQAAIDMLQAQLDTGIF